MRVIVCGGRELTEDYWLNEYLDEMPHSWYPLTIVHGACPTGADAMAARWAERRGQSVEAFPADRQKHGKAAGPIRNREMAQSGAGRCVALWNGKSPGTRNMIETAVQFGILVTIIPCMT